MSDPLEAPDCILRIRAMLKRTGLPQTTLYRKMDAGSFPPSVRISPRCVGWRESAVATWIRNPVFYSVDDHPCA